MKQIDTRLIVETFEAVFGSGAETVEALGISAYDYIRTDDRSGCLPVLNLEMGGGFWLMYPVAVGPPANAVVPVRVVAAMMPSAELVEAARANRLCLTDVPYLAEEAYLLEIHIEVHHRAVIDTSIALAAVCTGLPGQAVFPERILTSLIDCLDVYSVLDEADLGVLVHNNAVADSDDDELWEGRRYAHGDVD